MNNVCGVIVSYKPAEQLLDNLRQLQKQVAAIVVVDNGSPEETLAWLREASRQIGFLFIENPRNMGIAAAMNLGADWAIAAGYEWLAFFDQDSQVAEGCMASMLAASRRELQPSRPIAIYCPRYLDAESGSERPLFSRDEFGEPLVSMSSGSLIRSTVYAELGPFAEELFLYCVDDEYCLRAREQGYRLLRVPEAVLWHREGASSSRRLFGRSLYVTNQPPARRYYIMRNQWWMYCRYPRTFPRRGSRLGNLAFIFRNALRALLLEERRTAKCCAMLHGTTDFLCGRMGGRMPL